jgi:uncharacterized protein (TIGR00251 family)
MGSAAAGPSSRALEVLVRPGASRDEVGGEHAGALVIRLTAPPVEGRANKALRKLVSRRAGVPAGAVEIVRGERSRRKLIRVEGMESEQLRSLLERG